MSPIAIKNLQETETRRVTILHETARLIREKLDEARDNYGAEVWDEQAAEDAILNLVTENEPS